MFGQVAWRRAIFLVALLAPCVAVADVAAEREQLLRQLDAAVTSSRDAVPGLEAAIAHLNALIPAEFAERAAMAAEVPDEELAALLMQIAEDADSAAAAGDFETAVDLGGELVNTTMDLLGEHWLSADANRQLGDYYYQLGFAEPAEQHYLEAAAIAGATLGEDHPETLAMFSRLAQLYGAVGLFEDALGYNSIALEGLVDVLGPAHAQAVDARYLQVDLLRAAGLIEDAALVEAENCLLLDDLWSPYHDMSLTCGIAMARTQAEAGDTTAARATYDGVIARLADKLDSIDSRTVALLAEVADTYRIDGELETARARLGEIAATGVLMNDPEAVTIAKSYQGRVLAALGDYEAAQRVTEDVLDHALAAWQDNPVDIYNTMLELGAIYQRMGRLADAESMYEGALQGLLDLVGEMHPSTLVAMNNLGQVYEESGLYDEAEPLLKQALAGMEQVYGPDNPQSSRARNNLALLHESQGNFREAEPLYQRSLTLLGDSLGTLASDTIAVENNLAYLYMLMADFDQAANGFISVHEKWTRTLGENHQFTLKALNSLGRVRRQQGELEEAEQLVLTALASREATLGDNHLDVIRSMIDLGVIYLDQDRLDEAEAKLQTALDKAEAILGNEHPYTFEALNNLARVHEARADLAAALALRTTGFQRRSRFLDRMLWVTGENAREGYIRLHRPEFNDYLSLLARIGGEEAGRMALAASLQRKGLLLKVTSEIQQISNLATDPKLNALAAELEKARKDLAALTLSGPVPETAGRHAEALYELEQQVTELQGQLGRASARYRSSIAQLSVDTLGTVLPDGTALVDFLTYEQDGEGKVLAGIATRQDGELRFALVDYASRDDIDAAIIDYRTIIQDDAADEDELFDYGTTVHELLWAPVAAEIGALDYVYLVPDGTLNILPFNAVMDPDEQYLIQRYDLHILTSARDLLPNEYQLAQGEYVIVAGPDYDSADVVNVEALAAARQRRSGLQMDIRGAGSGLRGLNFAPLPGAAEEGRIITEQVQEQQEPSEVFFGEDAQEAVLAEFTRAPEILHVATHGFFLEADDNLRRRLLKLQRGADVQVPPPGDNPLLRAGLAFAGINNNAQFLGDIDTANDGVLTALEVLDLNLSGTRLVVLSACETGLGEIHEGEGVYGLRRSFQEAGVAEVISSLWEVSDAGTQALMTRFYDRLLAGTPARQALRETQLELMDSPEWGYPYVWSAFMIVGSYESAGVTLQ